MVLTLGLGGGGILGGRDIGVVSMVLTLGLGGGGVWVCGICLFDFFSSEINSKLVFPNDVSGDIGGCIARRVLKPKFY